MRHAHARGVRYFDTAPHYGSGLSEHRIGAALREVPRDAFLLSTKVGRLLRPDAHAPRDQHGYVDVLPFTQRWDYSYDATLRSVEDSLQRLGLARIDLVFIHDVACDAHGDAQPQRFREAMEGAVPALARLKAEGAIAGFGLGVNEWQVCVDALAHADLDVLLVAGRYTLLDQTALPVLLPLCARRGTRVVAGGPFNSGILATRHATGGRTRHHVQLRAGGGGGARARCRDRGCSAPRTGCRSRPRRCNSRAPTRRSPACSPGARSVAELDENLALAAFAIPAAFWRDLRGAPDSSPPTRRFPGTPRRDHAAARPASMRTTTCGSSRAATTAG